MINANKLEKTLVLFGDRTNFLKGERRCKNEHIVWHPGPWLNRSDRILILTRYTFFSRNSFERNSWLSVLGPKQFGIGWPTRKSFLGCTWVNTKCAEKISVGMWSQYRDRREPLGVTGSAVGWSGCYIWYQNRPLLLYGHVRFRSMAMWHIVAHVPALDGWMCAKRGCSWLGVDRRGHWSS
jgi:hypothetical protein